MTGSMECFTLLLPDFGRQGPLGLGDAGFGSFGRVMAGKARYVMSWSGAAWKDEARQAWLVQVCCGASGCVKVRYGGAGESGFVLVSFGRHVSVCLGVAGKAR